MALENEKDINSYLTWSNVFKAMILVCTCIWFISEQLTGDSARDFELTQAKKEVLEIKVIVKDIQNDIKNGATNSDGRLNSLEQDVKVLKNDVEYLKNIK